MPNLDNLSLGRRMLVITALSSLAAVFVTAGLVLVYEAATFQPRVLDELQLRAAVLEPNLRAAVSFFDSKAASEDLESLSRIREIRLAAVTDRWGEVLAIYARGPVGRPVTLPEQASSSHVFHDGHVDLWKPIEAEGERIGTLFIQRDLPPVSKRILEYGPMLGAVVFAVVSAALTLLVFMRRAVTGPVLRLSRAAETVIREADYSVRVPSPGRDEVSRLSSAFNEMLGTIEQREADLLGANEKEAALQERLNQSQKMESIGQLAGGVAHDFNNMLTVISGASELLLEKLPPDSPLQSIVRSSSEAANQAADLTRQLLAFARKQQVSVSVFDPRALVLSQRRMLSRLIGEDIEFEVRSSEEAWPIEVDSNQMAQVLMNLCCNARDAMPRGGKLTITVGNHVEGGSGDELSSIPPGEYARISVQDTGKGIDPEARKRIFEPFFTTKEQGRGTGLGLATCFGIVSQSGGHIEVSSEPGQGATFDIYLPRSRRAPTETPVGSREKTRSAPGSETILVVEDNDLVRATAVRALRKHGYTTIEAANGPEALRLADECDRHIDALVTDVVMPGMSGREIAGRLRSASPGLKVLYVSGFANEIVGDEDLADPNTLFLGKPYTSSSLADAVRRLIDSEKPVEEPAPL